MAARLIDGKARAERLKRRAAEAVSVLADRGIVPGLATVLVGEDPASRVYVGSKGRATAEAGMRAFDHRLRRETTTDELLGLVAALNEDDRVDGILVQLPLPDRIDAARVLEAVDPAKDVDGFHPVNVGLLASGRPALVPCTPQGCLILGREAMGDLSGAEALVIGRSAIVGRPMALLLLAADATVTIAHSRSRDLGQICRRADLVVAAVGRAQMVRGDWIKPGACVIDVGINRVPALDLGEGKTRLVGDVALDEAREVAGAITPVPGGVGPMTIACLIANTILAACRRRGIELPIRLI